jgi:hypothetical protein
MKSLEMMSKFKNGLLLVLLLTAGCATNSQGPGKFVFYPPPPVSPRIQFLVGFTAEQDLGANYSKLTEFVTGEKPQTDQIEKPYGIAMRGAEIFICDTSLRSICIMDMASLRMRRVMPSGAGQLQTPVNIAVDIDGTRYVADTGRHRVLVYGPDDAFRGEIGGGDKGAMKPSGVALTVDRLYVTDLAEHCIRVFEKVGQKFLFTIPRDPKVEQPGKLFMPVNIAVDAKGRVYASDIAACEVQVYDPEGRFLGVVGSRGDALGQFTRPKGIAVDRAGQLFVVDAAAQVCQIFDAEGKLLLFFGEPNGGAGSLGLPSGVWVEETNLGAFQKYVAPDFVMEELVMIANQYGGNKVNVYAVGHKK